MPAHSLVPRSAAGSIDYETGAFFSVPAPAPAMADSSIAHYL